MAERHTGSGIGTLVPETLLERLICYADKFYSKSGTMLRKSPDSISRSLSASVPNPLPAGNHSSTNSNNPPAHPLRQPLKFLNSGILQKFFTNFALTN